MKKIIIVTKEMVMGGVEKALISMLKSIPKDKYDVTVLVMNRGGELEDEIPDHIKIRCLYDNNTITKMLKYIKTGRLIRASKICWYTFMANRTKNKYREILYNSKMIPKIETDYDIAIAYHVPTSLPVVFVMNNIRAKSKMAWIHVDVSQYKKQLKHYKKFYEKYDKIYCVSRYAQERFIKLFPSLNYKTSVFYNIIDKNHLIKLADKDKGFNDGFEGIRILTVGRLDFEDKGQDIIPTILKKLRLEGHSVRWYCIGDGGNRLEMEDIIKKYNLKECLILLGSKRNPYTYIKQCDIYVQPSRYEGYCISLAEARAFNKPIITTDFVGAREQIENGKNGLIVNFNENEIYQAVRTLICNQNLCVKFENNLKSMEIDTKYEINKLLEGTG